MKALLEPISHSQQCGGYTKCQVLGTESARSHTRRPINTRGRKFPRIRDDSTRICKMDRHGTAVMVPLAAAVCIVANSQGYLALDNMYLAEFLRSKNLKSLYQSPRINFDILFLCIMFLRYARLVVHMYAKYFLYKSAPVLAQPRYSPKDVHVIVPTIDPGNADFERCIESIVAQAPGAVTIATAQDPSKQKQAEGVLEKYAGNFPHIEFGTVHSVVTNKRAQIVTVLDALFKNAESTEANKDKILVLVDDHVWWPSKFFFASLLAPFEDLKVGLVGTNKRPERDHGNSFSESLRNLIACAYLERHNFDVVTTNAIDGGAFVISARTCALRAAVCMSEEFRHGFTNEYFWTPWGHVGPLNPDDDNYITRYAMKKGWKIKFQCGEDAMMQTTLGTTGGWTKFRGQIIRWARSQWRSNSCSIFRDGKTTWTQHPWTALVYYTGTMFNFAAVWDPLIIYTWYRSSFNLSWYYLGGIILFSKLIKLWPLFKHNPQDIWMWPMLILFGYLHSFIKFYALLTFWDAAWSGRNLHVNGQTVTVAGDRELDRIFDSDGDTLGHSDGEPIGRGDNSALRSWNDSNVSSRSSSSSSIRSQRSRPPNIDTSHLPMTDSLMSAVSQGSAPMSISEGPSPVSLARRSLTPYFITDAPLPRSPSVTESFGSPPYKLSSESPSGGRDGIRRQGSTSFSSVDSSSSGFGFGNEESSGRIVETIKRMPIQTPWGEVSPSNIHRKPANLNMSFNGSSSGRSSRSRSRISTPGRRSDKSLHYPLSDFNQHILAQSMNRQVGVQTADHDVADTNFSNNEASTTAQTANLHAGARSTWDSLPPAQSTRWDYTTSTASTSLTPIIWSTPPQSELPLLPPRSSTSSMTSTSRPAPSSSSIRPRKSRPNATPPAHPARQPYTRAFHRCTTTCARLHSEHDSPPTSTPRTVIPVQECTTPSLGDAGAPIVTSRRRL